MNIMESLNVRNYLNKTLALKRQIKEAQSELGYLEIIQYSTQSNYYTEKVQTSRSEDMVFERNLIRKEAVIQKLENDKNIFLERSNQIIQWCFNLSVREAKYIQDRYLHDIPIDEIDYYSDRTIKRVIKKAIEKMQEHMDDKLCP